MTGQFIYRTGKMIGALGALIVTLKSVSNPSRKAIDSVYKNIVDIRLAMMNFPADYQDTIDSINADLDELVKEINLLG